MKSSEAIGLGTSKINLLYSVFLHLYSCRIGKNSSIHPELCIIIYGVYVYCFTYWSELWSLQHLGPWKSAKVVTNTMVYGFEVW